MSHTQERPRRLSYAGLVKPPQQKSRRISDAGQCGINLLGAHHSLGGGGVSEVEPNHSTSVVNGETMSSGRYDVNKNRPSRRTSRPTDDSFTCSQQSILSAMDRFVRSVNNMDSTVLVPSRLQDIDVQNENSKFSRCLPPGLNNTDVYGFYSMLKDVKNELLWGPSIGGSSPSPPLPYSGRSSPRHTTVMKHVRQPSDDSLGSTGFPSDQETDSDIESVLTDRDSVDEHSSAGSHLAVAFRHHLQSLHIILHELADSADFLSSRYQEEVDASCL